MAKSGGARQVARRPATVLLDSRNLVIKVGSSLLVDATQTRREWMGALARDIAVLKRRGVRVTLVSSGAVALGRSDRHSRNAELADKQASAAIGQVQLAAAWGDAFSAHGISVGQVLLTPADTEHRRRHLNARATLAALERRDALAVINENDTVATEELRYGDNDQLAARVAQMIDADCLLLLSDVDGLLSKPPGHHDAQLIAWVDQVTPELMALAEDSATGVGTGGMRSKLVAAQRATRAGATVIIANGRVDQPLDRLLNGAPATVFGALAQPGSARRRWIGGMLKRNACIVIDDGAALALREGKSLLGVGVVRQSGAFDLGDCLAIEDEAGHELGVGLAGMSSEDAKVVRSEASPRPRPLIHRDDLVLHPEQAR